MKKLIFLLMFCFSAITALEPLNELEYNLTTENVSLFSNDSTLRISQNDQLLCYTEVQWSKVAKSGDIAFILRDSADHIVGIAKAYRNHEDKSDLYLEILNSDDQILGKLVLIYPKGSMDPPTKAILYSASGVPLFEDKLSFFVYHLYTYVPGSENLAVDMYDLNYFTNFNKVIKILDLRYLAEMNISPELFYLYMSIRKDMNIQIWQRIGYIPE